MRTGEKIREARKAAGLTQKELGTRLDVTSQNIIQYEKGRRLPKPATLRRIAEAIGCTLFDLIGDDMKISKEDWEELGREDFSADPEPIGEDPGPIREDERSLLRYYRELDGTRKEKVVDYAADQWSLQNMERTAPEDGPGHIQN